MKKPIHICAMKPSSDPRPPVVIFSATLAAAGLALLGMWRVGRRQRPATGGNARAASRSPQSLVLILLATAAVSSGLAFFKPGLGAMVWVVFLVLAAVVGRRQAGHTETTHQ